MTAAPGRTYAHEALGRLTGATAGGVTATYTLGEADNHLAKTSFDLDLSLPNPPVLADGTKTYLPGARRPATPRAGRGGRPSTISSAHRDLVGSPVTRRAADRGQVHLSARTAVLIARRMCSSPTRVS